MSPASHMVGRLRKLYGIVWNRMHGLNERPAGPSRRSRPAGAQSIMEPLEPRLLLSDTTGLGPVLPYLPPQHWLINQDGYLTGPSAGRPLDIAMGYLESHAGELGVTAQDIKDSVVTDQTVSSDTGVTHIYLRQQYNGLEIANANLSVNVTADGRVENVGGGFVAGLDDDGQYGAMSLASPGLTAWQALAKAGANLGLACAAGTVVTSAAGGIESATTLANPALSLDPIPARLQYVATHGGVELAWDVVMRTPDHDHWYDVSVNAFSGASLAVSDWVDEASYNVFALPTETPDDGPRTVVTDPSSPAFSPFGWHDTNGSPGAEYTDTRGNNVFAQEDWNADDSGGTRPDGGSSLTFDFPLNLTVDPHNYVNAAVTNLFYWNNTIHDIHAAYGFDEQSGNFQVTNYSGLGAGNDAVQADAQDGEGMDNANFGTPPDGYAPRMQMFEFDLTSPLRDGDFESVIMTHEYGHGVSNRLVGGPSNVNALDALQSGGMGEGWGDWWGLMFTMKPTDTKMAAYPIATYVVGQSPTGAGIRRHPYSFDMSIDPETLGTYNISSEVHDAGEIWCTVLWDMSWLLMDAQGYSADIAHGYHPGVPGQDMGNNLALQLVMDSLKLMPANPTFLQARDAILQADVNLTGGANQAIIWTAFARRGFGFSANCGADANSTTVTQAFDMPSPDPIVTSSTPSGSVLLPVSAMSFTFNEAMNPASFAVADDVASFTGPGGANLKPQITGFTWSNGNKTLTVSFTSQSQQGIYTMVIGPQILAADDGHPMNQDLDAILGEVPDDQYTGSFQGVVPVYQANMDVNPGWTISGGQWAWGHPIGGGGLSHGNPDPSNGFTGSNVIGVNLSGDYNNTAAGGPWYVTTPAIDCSGYANVSLDFMRWLNTDYPPYANATIEASNNGTTWTSVYANSGTVSDSAWQHMTYSLSSVADGHSTVYVRWGYQVGTDAWAYSGWNIDDVALIGTVTGPDLAGPRVTSQTPSGSVFGAQASIQFGFNEAMDTTSFSVGADVVSFTGPGGVDLRPQITGFTWVDNRTLRVAFASQAALGAYTMVIGPDITDDAPSFNPMNQDGDATNGEVPDDRYTGSFTIALMPAGRIEGDKWSDLDGDGVRDAGEPALAGWTMYLDANGNGTLDAGEQSAVTNAAGHYVLDNLAPGTYSVREVPQAGWAQTYPVTASGRLFAVRAAGAAATIYELNPATGAAINSFAAPAEIAFGGPQGLAVGPTSLFYVDGSTFPHTLWELDLNTGSVIDADVVDAAAPAEIAGVGYLGGKVYMEQDQLDSILVWDPASDTPVATLPVAADLLGGLTGAADMGVLFDTDPSGNIFEIDPVSGAVLGMLSPGVGPLFGGLAYVGGSLFASPFSPAPTVYRINPATGAVLGSFSPGGNGLLSALGGDGVGAGNGAHVVILGAGQIVTGQDFGNHGVARIEGDKWSDLDGDGVRDAGEPTLAGWTIYLDLDGNGALTAGEPTRLTDAAGHYVFDNLTPGTYTVREVPQAGWTQTYPMTGTGYLATAVPFEFEDISATGAPVLTGIDDGFVPLTAASLAGFQFDFYGTTYTDLYVSSNGLITFGSGTSDLGNGDLTSNPTQATIAVFWDDLVIGGGTNSAVYWQVLGTGSDQRLVIQWNDIRFFGGAGLGQITFQAVLSEQGNSIQYNYLDLDSSAGGAGGASATVGVKDVGAQGTNRLLLCDNNGPTSLVGTGLSTRIFLGGGGGHTVVLGAGQTATGQDFGNQAATARIEGDKWNDLDGDGVRDAGEPALPGWTVFLDADNDGMLDAGEPTQITNANGHYVFPGLAPGNYTVREVLQPGWTQTYPTAGTGYQAAAAPPAFEDVSTTGTAVLVGADDQYTHLTAASLAGFQFDFYGTTYTDLYVSSNGLITFGSGTSTLDNGDLTDEPSQAAIAALWDDLVIGGGTNSAVDWQVLGTGSNQRLVIQWNDISFFDGEGAGQITFQAVLSENGNSIQLNYLDLDSAAGGAGGATATVGIKDAGTQGPDRLLLCDYSGPNSYVGTGLSTLVFPLTAGSHKVVVGPGQVVTGQDFGNHDVAPPVADVVDVVPDPRTTPVGQVSIVFSEPVTGLDLADLVLTRSGGGNLLTAAQTLTTTDGITWTVGNLTGLTAAAGSYVLTLVAGGSGIVDASGNPLAADASEAWVTNSTVAGRHIFYNNSYWDGNDAGANAGDDAAIAPDKQPLLPGQTATFANYTSYSKGINGIMADIAGLGDSAGLTVQNIGNYFTFKAGNDSSPGAWAAAPAPAAVLVRPGAGANGSDRVTITWADGAIAKRWLQVTTLANSSTGLASPDVFYFGNAIGEVGNVAAPQDAKVTTLDVSLTRSNLIAFPSAPTILNVYDFNRDHKVNTQDVSLVRANLTTAMNALKLITPPAGALLAELPPAEQGRIPAALAPAAPPQAGLAPLAAGQTTDEELAAFTIVPALVLAPAVTAAAMVAEASATTIAAPVTLESAAALGPATPPAEAGPATRVFAQRTMDAQASSLATARATAMGAGATGRLTAGSAMRMLDILDARLSDPLALQLLPGLKTLPRRVR